MPFFGFKAQIISSQQSSAPNPTPSSVCEDLPAGVNWPDSMGALCDFFVTGKIAGNWPGCDTSMDTGYWSTTSWKQSCNNKSCGETCKKSCNKC